MKKWYYVNQQVYNQFTFFVKAESMLEADREHRQNTILVKCKFCGTVCTEDESPLFLLFYYCASKFD